MADARRPDAPADQGEAVARPGPNAAAFHWGAGHLVMHGNPAFLERYGRSTVGQPAREAMLDLPAAAFDLMARVLEEGRPLATVLHLADGSHRFVVVPRTDPETGEVYGVTTHLRG